MPLPIPPWPARLPSVPAAARRALRLPALVASGLIAAGVSGCAPSAGRAPAVNAISRWEDRRLADVDSLTLFMGSRDAHVRLAATRAAGRIGRDDAVAALVRTLDDRSAAVRAEAAAALGFIGSPQGTGALTKLLATRDRQLRVAAIEALGRVPGGGLPLLGPARRANMREACAAWDGLRERTGELPADTLRAALGDGLARDERPVLWRVLRCAEKAAPDSGLTILIARHAHTRDPQVRVHALRALGAQGLPSALAAILESGEQELTLPGYERTRVRVALLRALGRCGHALLAGSGPSAPDYGPLTAQLADGSRDRDPQVVRTALEAMSALVEGSELPAEATQRESLLPVWRLRLARAAQARLNDADAPVRAAALLAYGALRGAAGAPELVHVLAIGSQVAPQVAAAAAQGLGLGGDPNALTALAVAAGHGRPPLVREAALEAVGALWRRHRTALSAAAAAAWRHDALALLTPAVRDADFAVAATAAEQMGQLPAPESAAALVRLLAALRDDRDGARDIRLGAYAGLEALGRAGALRPAAAAAGAAPTVSGVAALPDSLRQPVTAVLERGFDNADLRVRLQARAAAAASGLFAADLVPSEDSLRETAPPNRRDPRQPPLTGPYAAPRLRCVTARGEFLIALDGRQAPNTASAVARLARDGFYRDLAFHRVVPDFVVQGGDPRGDGWGGPGWTLRAERSRIPYERGTVGIADSGFDTGGSQFFVCLSAQPHLTGRYTVVGRVVRGMHVLDTIEPGDTFSLEVVP